MKSISSDSAYSKTETHIFWNSEKKLTEASQVENPKRGVSKSKRTGREKVEKRCLEGFSGIPKTILRRSCESRKSLCQRLVHSSTECLISALIEGKLRKAEVAFDNRKRSEKRPRNDCSTTPKISEKLASSASLEILTSLSKLFFSNRTRPEHSVR